MPKHLKEDQALFVAGACEGDQAHQAWFVRGNHTAQPEPQFSCRAEEADTQLWLHAERLKFNNVLVLSSGTDVYHIE